MAARGLTKKEMKSDEFRESVWSAEQWLEENWRTVLMWVGGIAVIALLTVGWHFLSKSRQASAQARLSEGLRMYRAAVNPDSGEEGTFEDALVVFDEVTGKFGAGPAADVALYYQGLSALQIGDTETAAALLREAASESLDPLIRGAAGAAFARALLANGDPDGAVEALTTVADDPDGAYPPDLVLVEAGRIRFEQGNADAAREIWNDVVARYPDSQGAREAERQLSLLEG